MVGGERRKVLYTKWMGDGEACPAGGGKASDVIDILGHLCSFYRFSRDQMTKYPEIQSIYRSLSNI